MERQDKRRLARHEYLQDRLRARLQLSPASGAAMTGPRATSVMTVYTARRTKAMHLNL